ncbi:hypothetical protein PRZ48_005203 [Zasmidium cellare]|uniref:Zn(2)-C6 fungal-type domain-containing protein n=1 Tax=Zasmidium cellare TaxID=395010 RepID=A0ABR0ERS3_ZASCE|nr:hypothetical protein PRZ48_005203 [Zasmidium cellare]
MSPSISGPSGRQPQQGLHLACRECQRKKIKCDRTYPCGQCSRSGLSCVSSTRKPRAKAGTKGDAELRQRIAKLEKLVESFQGDEGSNEANSASPMGMTPSPGAIPDSNIISSANLVAEPQDSRSPSSQSETSSPYTNKYVAGTFWSSLTSEVKALADAFEEDNLQSDDESGSPDNTPSSGAPYALDGTSVTSNYELIFCPPGVLYVMPGALNEPDPKMAAHLFHTYLAYVESVQKLLHIPTVRPFLEEGKPYLNRPADAPCNKALKAAIYFSGVNACTDEECMTIAGKTRDQMAQEFRRMVDVALYQADPLNTTEIATLQALTLYVASIRVLDSSRRAWSMVGLLVRIARAMSIHRELAGETAFIAEQRRRLWYNIVFLDCFASVDRGTEAAIHAETFNRQLPHNVNDADFNEDTPVITSREGEVTECTMALVAQEGSITALHLALAEESPGGISWQKRLEMAYAYQRTVNEKYLKYCDPLNPLHQPIIGTGVAAINSMLLRAVRPVQHSPASPPPRVDSPWVMQLALNILRHQQELWEYIIQSRWRRMPWVPWHAMAVALAGICSMENNKLADEAWDLCEKAMKNYVNDVADASNGGLWRPIQKLYKKAKASRERQQMAATATQQNTTMNEISWDPDILHQPITSDPTVTMGMTTEPFNVPVPNSSFDFPPEMQAALPNDNSWLDWEAILKDMDEIKADDMQWLQNGPML